MTETPVIHSEQSWILDKVRAGNRQACTELVREHYGPIFRFLANLTGDSNSAEDLTQETFASVWVNIGKFENRSSLRTWIYRIAYNKFADARRRLRRRELERARETPPVTISPLNQLIVDERSQFLSQVVRRLDEENLTVIVLHYFQGLSFRQMAEVLGEPEGTVKWRTNQALKKIKSELAERYNHDGRKTKETDPIDR